MTTGLLLVTMRSFYNPSCFLMYNGPAYVGRILLVIIMVVLYQPLHFLSNSIPLSSCCPWLDPCLLDRLAYLPTSFCRHDDVSARIVRAVEWSVERLQEWSHAAGAAASQGSGERRLMADTLNSHNDECELETSVMSDLGAGIPRLRRIVGDSGNYHM